MKKLLSLVLILCMCLPFVLTGCGDSGEKNAYQAFAAKAEKSSTHSLDGAVLEEINSGEFDEKKVSNGYTLKGQFSVFCGKNPNFLISMSGGFSKPTETDNPAYYYDLSFTMNYNVKENTMKAYFGSAKYRTSAVDDGKSITWTDGYLLSDSRQGHVLSLSFDMSKYFENGELKMEDATVVNRTEEKSFIENISVVGSKYTERHPDWETELQEQLLFFVNKALKQVDSYIAKH